MPIFKLKFRVTQEYIVYAEAPSEEAAKLCPEMQIDLYGRVVEEICDPRNPDSAAIVLESVEPDNDKIGADITVDANGVEVDD